MELQFAQRVPHPKDRCCFSLFITAAAATSLYFLVFFSERWRSAQETSTYVRSTQLMDGFVPQLDLCAFVPEGAFMLPMLVTFPEQAHMLVEYNMDPLYLPHALASRDDIESRLQIQAKEIAPADVEARVEVVWNAHRYRSASFLACSKAQTTDMTCVTLNSAMRNIVTRGAGDCAFPFVSVLLLYPRNETHQDVPSAAGGWEKLMSMRLSVPNADSRNVHDTRAADTQIFSNEAMYNIRFTSTRHIDLSGEETDTYSIDGIYWSQKPPSPVFAEYSLFAFAVDKQNYSSAFFYAPINPSSFFVEVLREVRPYGFGDWFSSLGGMFGGLSALFSLLFPSVWLLPRQTRFRVAQLLCPDLFFRQCDKEPQTAHPMQEQLLEQSEQE